MFPRSPSGLCNNVSVMGMEEEVESRGCGFSEKAICPDHVDDAVLKERIRAGLSEEACSSCQCCLRPLSVGLPE